MSTTTILTIASIAAGGALGAVLRYATNMLSQHLWGNDIPYGTLIVNILGSFLMGVLIAGFAHIWQPPKLAQAFLVTGFLGAYTTFSTFSLDVSALFERGAYLAMGGYMTASVVLSIIALFAGLAFIRGLV